MKKLLIAALMLFGIATVSFAQTAAPAKTKTTKAKTTTTSTGPTKKDGTLDMRYKANKDAGKKAAGPTKKDGTPDMRYKSNNKDAGKKAAPVKKAA